MSLLSLSPLLSSLFVSYANRIAALEFTTATPTLESEDWKARQNNTNALREANEWPRSENHEMVLKLEAAEVLQETFRSQISSLKQACTTQQDEIKALRRELLEGKDAYDRLVKNLNAEKAAHKVWISDLEVGSRLR
jgi:chromosome segregation ATPase